MQSISDVNAFTHDFTTNIANYRAALTYGPAQAGATFRLMSIKQPHIDFADTPGYTVVWTTIDGTNIIPANSLAIGHTIEFDAVGSVFTSKPVPASDGPVTLRVDCSGGVIFSLLTKSLTLQNYSDSENSFHFNIKMTRINAGQIAVWASGAYDDNTGNSKMINFSAGPLSQAYNPAVAITFEVLEESGASPGNQYDFRFNQAILLQHTNNVPMS